MIKLSTTLWKVLFFTVLQSCCFSDNLIVYLISPPRSLSTAFLRCIEARGDFSIFHEPSLGLSYKGFEKQERPPHALSYESLKNALLSAAENSHVFVKEVAFSLTTQFLNDFEWMQKSNVYFFFLIRDPHAALLSYHKKMPISPLCRKYEIAYESAYNSFEELKAHAKNPPLILFSEDFAANPKETFRLICDYVGIDFKEDAFSWNPHTEEFAGESWHECKHKKSFNFWHDAALKSSSIQPITSYEVDENNLPTFNEIRNKQMKEDCKKMYEKNLFFYRLFKEIASNQRFNS